MSWSSGSGLFSDLIYILKRKIDEDSIREEIYAEMIEIFEDHDCDTLDECVGNDPAFDKVFKQYLEENYVEEELDEEY